MGAIKFQEVLRCSSEDVHFPAQNLSTGGKWLSSRKQDNNVIEVEFLLQKEALITFVDIGNEGSQFVDLLVGHSMRTKAEYFTLLPTFTFMSVAECKQQINRRKVLMFKKEDMMTDISDKTWDKLKIVCRQAYSNDTQFGLNFICLRNLNSASPISSLERKPQMNCNQKALNSFFGLNTDIETESKKSLPKALPTLSSSPVLRKIESSKQATPQRQLAATPISTKSLPSSPRLQVDDHSEFIKEVVYFLDELNENILSQAKLKVSDLRRKLEEQRGKPLSKTKKKLFMVMLAERTQELNRKCERANINNATEEINSTPSHVPTTTTALPNGEQKCNNCGISFPSDIASIHSKICTIPKQSRNSRNSLCMDLSSDTDVDDQESPVIQMSMMIGNRQIRKHHRRVKESGSYKLTPNSNISMRRKSRGTYSSATKTKLKDAGDLEISPLEDVFQPPDIKRIHLDPITAINPINNNIKGSSIGNGYTVNKVSTTDKVRINGIGAFPDKLSNLQPRTLFSANTRRRDSGEGERKHTEVISKANIDCDFTSPSNDNDDIDMTRYQPTSKTSTNSDITRMAAPDHSDKTLDKRSSFELHERSELGNHNNNSVNIKLISFNRPTNGNMECPMCSEKFPVETIEMHAEFCNGKSSPVVVEESQSNDFCVDDAIIVEEDPQTQCPICKEQISIYRIGIHSSLCAISKEKIHATFVNSKQTAVTDNFSTSPIAHSSSNVSKCPICSNEFDESYINMHVNICLDATA